MRIATRSSMPDFHAKSAHVVPVSHDFHTSSTRVPRGKDVPVDHAVELLSARVDTIKTYVRIRREYGENTVSIR